MRPLWLSEKKVGEYLGADKAHPPLRTAFSDTGFFLIVISSLNESRGWGPGWPVG